MRFAVSGALLAGLCGLRGRSIWPARGDLLPILLLGAVVYTAETSFFFAAVDHGSASAAIIIVYLYPAFVTVFEAVRQRRRPSSRMVRILSASVLGSALVAGAGGRVELEAIGLVFALGAATTFALYVILGARVGKRSDPMVTGAWVALGASVTFIAAALVGPGYAAAAGHWPALLGNGVANAVAFGMMFSALSLLGSARTSVVLTLEVVFAVALSVALLDESLTPLQVVGAVAVLFAAVVVFRSPAEPERLPESTAHQLVADRKQKEIDV